MLMHNNGLALTFIQETHFKSIQKVFEHYQIFYRTEKMKLIYRYEIFSDQWMNFIQLHQKNWLWWIVIFKLHNGASITHILGLSVCCSKKCPKTWLIAIRKWLIFFLRNISISKRSSKLSLEASITRPENTKRNL